MNPASREPWVGPQRRRPRATFLEKLQAVLILLAIAAIIVGACVWFFAFDSPAVWDQKQEPQPFYPPKPANAENFKP